jgi:tetratricopeptide (TPR) repeat protein
MKFTVAALTTFAAINLLAADTKTQTEKNHDHCSVPAGAAAPALPAKLMEGMGRVDFKITTKSPEAQKFFNQGIAQMHSFWTKEAERSFLQAAQLDPEAPMPWFGVAMVAGGQYQPRFQVDNWEEMMGPQARTTKRAWDAAQKALDLAKVPGKATELEQLYVAAVAARRIPVAKQNSDDAYIAAWKALLAKYPDEVEAKTFLSLHLMRGFDLPSHQPKLTSMEAIELLRPLIAKYPEHPGVHHYVIHGWEGSAFAKEAWTSSAIYLKLAPGIPHALHMPGHIYSQTGKWDEAIESFSLAKAKELEYMAADRAYGNGHHGHNVHYLSTVYSFKGDYDSAVREAQHLLSIKETEAQQKSADLFTDAYAQGFIAMLRALTQHQKWEAILEGKMLPEISRPRQEAWTAWARGIAWANTGKPAQARTELKRMETALARFQSRVKNPLPRELTVAREELMAQILLASGKKEKGLKALELAAQHERQLRYTEPPYYARPAYEALGHWAVKLGQPALARRAYEQAVDQFPGDVVALRALQGLAPNAQQPSGGLQ